MESADVFGFVPIRLTTDSGITTSGRLLSQWLASKMGCDELAIGQIQLLPDMVIVGVHSSKVSLALKAFEKYDFDGQKLLAEV
ncbi:MAG TPA: hypothetical protein HA327_07585, partial [Candidatus Poseidoniaceae archaeon]